MHMKFRAIAAAAALFSMAVPTVSTAQDDSLSYPKLTHCAAFNMFLAQVMGMGADKDKAENKVQAETFTNQAAALIVLATVVSKKDSEAVQGEVFAENETMMKSMSQEGAAEKLLQADLETCNNLGKAAYAALQEASKK